MPRRNAVRMCLPADFFFVCIYTIAGVLFVQGCVSNTPPRDGMRKYYQ